MRRVPILLCVLVGAMLLAPAAPAVAAPITGAPAPFLESGGFVVAGPFYTFTMAHGGLEALGQPITGELHDAELGVPVQYFTYARLERHLDGIRLTRLGSRAVAGRESEPAFQWRGPDTALEGGRRYVPESGHTLGGAFGWYHAQHGAVALLGHPISEEFAEPRPGGTPILVQYFERARLEYDPEVHTVRRAPLGAWLAAQLVPPALRAPAGTPQPLASATLTYRPRLGSSHNLELAAARLHGAVVEPGQQLSFLGAIGPISAAAGYRPGQAVVDGQIVEGEVGGGICSVATLLYRAAWVGGMPVVERRGHSRWLTAFADAPGLDAAVALPGPDLRIHNDTGARLFVAAVAGGGRATVTLWGLPDGRRVELAPPLLVTRGDTLTVTTARSVRGATEALQRHERVTTRYRLAGPSPVRITRVGRPGW